MHSFRNCLLSLFVLTSSINSVYAQQECCCQEYDTTGEAYAQSSFNSHWSAFIPVALIVGAAIWFGVADCCSSGSSNSNSKDGLGSLANKNGSKSHGSHSSNRANSHSGHY